MCSLLLDRLQGLGSRAFRYLSAYLSWLPWERFSWIYRNQWFWFCLHTNHREYSRAWYLCDRCFCCVGIQSLQQFEKRYFSVAFLLLFWVCQDLGMVSTPWQDRQSSLLHQNRALCTCKSEDYSIVSMWWNPFAGCEYVLPQDLFS